MTLKEANYICNKARDCMRAKITLPLNGRELTEFNDVNVVVEGKSFLDIKKYEKLKAENPEANRFVYSKPYHYPMSLLKIKLIGDLQKMIDAINNGGIVPQKAEAIK